MYSGVLEQLNSKTGRALHRLDAVLESVVGPVPGYRVLRFRVASRAVAECSCPIRLRVFRHLVHKRPDMPHPFLANAPVSLSWTQCIFIAF